MLRLEEARFSKPSVHSTKINDITFQKVFFRGTACESGISYIYDIHSAVTNDRPQKWMGINMGMRMGIRYRLRNANILVWRMAST